MKQSQIPPKKATVRGPKSKESTANETTVTPFQSNSRSKSKLPISRPRPGSVSQSKHLAVKSRKGNRAPGLSFQTISHDFYTHVNALSKDLKEGQSPCAPENYRCAKSPNQNSEDHILSYEEELHLADHFAFLAHAEEGVEFVSAVTLEETLDPPGLTVRLASNHTPTTHVVDGLRSIVRIIKAHACEGKHRDNHMRELFHEVIKLSQKRIYGRLRSSQWKKPNHIGSSHSIPLCVRIEHKMTNSRSPFLKDSNDTEQLSSLRHLIVVLVDSLRRVDGESQKDPLELLKDVIYKSHSVSTYGGSRSLESHLRKLSISYRVNQDREVLEIDKLSKYLDLCHDFVRVSRQPRTRSLCMNLKLEVCTAHNGVRPPGARSLCFVHGEVQLVLFYEQFPRYPLPRAIGSSKSACCLCDLFIKKHGVFGISHSHMKLYPKWRIPDAPWMDPRQVQRFRDIVSAMDLEITTLLKRKCYYGHLAMESRAHILQITQASSIAPSTVGPGASDVNLAINSKVIAADSISSEQKSAAQIFVSSSKYNFLDLPVSINIAASTVSCTLLVGHVDYIFDLEDVNSGNLSISESKVTGAVQDNPRMNIRDLPQTTPTTLKCKTGSRTLVFCVHDAEQYMLQVRFTWLD